jgi:hypothetical protein
LPSSFFPNFEAGWKEIACCSVVGPLVFFCYSSPIIN